MRLASACSFDDDTRYTSQMLGMDAVHVTEPEDLKPDHLLVLWGGEDISPSLYGQKRSRAIAMDEPSIRDKKESALVKKAIEIGLPILGICRGAQLVCALLGGKLWQHVDNHEGKDHPLIYKGGYYNTNSFHHQMMIPTDDMEILAYAYNRSKIKWDEEATVDEGDEPEIVWAPKAKALLIQGHPEWVDPTHDLYTLTKQLVKEKLCSK